ncbi:hypothetical protein ACGFI3_42860 [Nonomuraea wenchangensis]|uniref:hypothetical protein n=1 Tax=Nonomuraea wenchangensis TaxID=568860 RepID=UPI0037175781
MAKRTAKPAMQHARAQLGTSLDVYRASLTTISAREKTDAARQALADLLDSGQDVGLSREFIEAFDAELRTARTSMDDLHRQVKALQDHVIKAFQWGSDSAWSLAVELDMDAAAISRSARSQIDMGVFTAVERQHLVSALNDVLDAREGLVDGWKPAPMPFDSEGRCGDPSCLSCRTSQASA